MKTPIVITDRIRAGVGIPPSVAISFSKAEKDFLPNFVTVESVWSDHHNPEMFKISTHILLETAQAMVLCDEERASAIIKFTHGELLVTGTPIFVLAQIAERSKEEGFVSVKKSDFLEKIIEAARARQSEQANEVE